MMKFLMYILLVATVSAQWRPGVRDSRCPAVNGEKPVLLPGETCPTFYICNDGYRFPFTCPTGLYFNPSLSVCDHPESSGCV